MKIATKALNEDLKRIFQGMGFSQQEALYTANSMLFAELRGVCQYGVRWLQELAQKAQSEAICKNSTPEILMKSAGAFRIDAKNAIGPYAARYCMELCVSEAVKNGCAVASVIHLEDYGLGAYLARFAMEESCVTFCISAVPNAEQKHVVIGLPTAPGCPPVIIDKILAQDDEMEELLLLQLMCEALGCPCEDESQYDCENNGCFMGAIHITSLTTINNYQKLIAGRIKKLKENEGFYLPGELAHNQFHVINNEGVEMTPEELAKIKHIAEQYDVQVEY